MNRYEADGPQPFEIGYEIPKRHQVFDAVAFAIIVVLVAVVLLFV